MALAIRNTVTTLEIYKKIHFLLPVAQYKFVPTNEALKLRWASQNVWRSFKELGWKETCICQVYHPCDSSWFTHHSCTCAVVTQEASWTPASRLVSSSAWRRVKYSASILMHLRAVASARVLALLTTERLCSLSSQIMRYFRFPWYLNYCVFKFIKTGETKLDRKVSNFSDAAETAELPVGVVSFVGRGARQGGIILQLAPPFVVWASPNGMRQCIS